VIPVETVSDSKAASDPKLKLGENEKKSTLAVLGSCSLIKISLTLATSVIDVNHLEVGVKI